jgi:hypothetical protein
MLIATVPAAASAQEPDTLVISGTFVMNRLEGSVGPEIAQVGVNANDHSWSLTLHGVTYSHDFEQSEYVDEWSYQYSEQYVTRVHATSFEFAFIGADADILNTAVSQQLTNGRFPGDAFLELRNAYWYYDYFGEIYSGTGGSWGVGLHPANPLEGISFSSNGHGGTYAADGDGYPLVQPRRVWAEDSAIIETRDGTTGSLHASPNYVYIGSADLPPILLIEDASAWEGKKGTTQRKLTVVLSNSSTTQVTVRYATADGTALAKSDYNKTSGTLTFPAGQMQGTISIGVKGDRKREANETFTVKLSNAVGATIGDGVATVTILNDD